MTKIQACIERLLTTHRPSAPGAYVLALLFFLLALAGRASLDFIVPGSFPFITFFPAVALAAVFCGFVPSIAAGIMSGIAGIIWIAPGEYTLLYYITGLVLFCLVAGLIIILIEALRRAYLRLQDRDEQLGMINDELSHRMRNLFTIASALTSQTIRNGSSPGEMISSLNGRFAALATSHGLLGMNLDDAIALKTLIKAVIEPMSPAPARLEAGGSHVKISGDVATAMALVLHELATNALKYGAWSNAHGKTILRWEVDLEKLTLRWSEHDGPPVNAPERLGAGSTLIQNAISGANVEYHLEPDGVRCLLEIPLSSSGIIAQAEVF